MKVDIYRAQTRHGAVVIPIWQMRGSRLARGSGAVRDSQEQPQVIRLGGPSA